MFANEFFVIYAGRHVFNQLRDELTELRHAKHEAARAIRGDEPEMQARLFDDDEQETEDQFLESSEV